MCTAETVHGRCVWGRLLTSRSEKHSGFHLFPQLLWTLRSVSMVIWGPLPLFLGDIRFSFILAFVCMHVRQGKRASVCVCERERENTLDSNYLTPSKGRTWHSMNMNETKLKLGAPEAKRKRKAALALMPACIL